MSANTRLWDAGTDGPKKGGGKKEIFSVSNTTFVVVHFEAVLLIIYVLIGGGSLQCCYLPFHFFSFFSFSTNHSLFEQQFHFIFILIFTLSTSICLGVAPQTALL